jgi:preprotein translocase subunit SecG
MQTALVVFHVVVALTIVIAVLLQSGKGGGLGAGFGGGGANTLFGASGGGNFFTRLTTVLAVLFMATSLGLTVYKSRQMKSSLFDSGAAPVTAPATSTEAPAAAKDNAAPVENKK